MLLQFCFLTAFEFKSHKKANLKEKVIGRSDRSGKQCICRLKFGVISKVRL